METYTWYQSLIKPMWAPPSWIFGPVWTVLYLIIFISFGYVIYNAFKKKISLKIATPFILNLIFNLSFSPIQFGLKNNILAAIDIMMVLGTMLWAFKAIWPKVRWIVYINIPYLLWVTFATFLQLTITYLNR